ncbi:tRNA dihydrouridine(20/20a) synthase DusA [Candidatus Methylocalor cossyra]|uniref:tRNA-dihydrouridine(20/20a) synthase n=1 Tax=Candidatus Methylocalor cossyra TaxID=3108543 RepID=A0ABM9NKG0_9GAMM
MKNPTLPEGAGGFPELGRRLAVAPMLDWTDRHCRYFLRLISRRTLLYTEMITTGAILHGDRDRLLAFHPREKPLAVQLGGCDPGELAACARLAEALGFDEVNLNVGCPSGRVQRGRFGACLMAEPERVAECVAAMAASVSIPVTVKTRIGIDQRDSYQDLAQFVATVAAGGCRTFIIHARKAWLNGLSPKENRAVPPLRYDLVEAIKRDFPALEIVLNGGIGDLDQAEGHLARFDGVMIGRAVYHNPYLLAEADRRIFGDDRPIPSREDILRGLFPYIAEELAKGTPLHAMTRHLMGLFHGVPGGRQWRRYLSERAARPGADWRVLRDAPFFGTLHLVRDAEPARPEDRTEYTERPYHR